MPFGRNQRLDPRRSSQYGSTTTIAVFVALCLVGVWMMTSSTVVPVDVSNTNSEVKQDLSETDAKPLKDSKDNGDASINMDASTSDSLSEPSAEKIEGESVKQNGAITAEGENSLQDGEDNKDVPTDTSKNEEYNDANGTPKGGEMVKEGVDATAGDKKNTEQLKSMEQNSDGAEEKQNKNSPANKEQERNTAQNSDEKENTDQNNSSQNSNATLNDEQQQSDTENNPVQDENRQGQIEVDRSQDKNSKKGSGKKNPEGLENEDRSSELLPSGSQLELLNETNMQTGAWSTQADESKNEKDVQTSLKGVNFSWKLCNVSGGADYIPCLDNVEAIQKLTSTKHYEHRERHCPEVPPTCLVPLPEAYKVPIEWPSSRDKIWYHNVPHTQLAAIKGHQNWVKVSGEYITFPGGGTQFKHGALHYIDVIQEAMPDISWGKRSRVVLDVGCGVASFGGYLFDRDVLTMSLAPKDEHEAQVQFALERGIPAISAVMGTKRLPFPGRAFDVIHCARCRVPWHVEGGMLLLELNRLLRPGGYFVWSATPVYRNDTENAEIWKAMKELTTSLCWEMVVTAKDEDDQVGLAIFRMPSNNSCYEKRKQSTPPFCQKFDDPNAAWNVPLQACMHKLPADPYARGAKWPEQWPLRLEKAPYWLNSSQIGVFGKPAPDDFTTDQEHWNNVVRNSYANGMGIDWSKVRNVMDMRSVYGGFAAALQDRKLWVMNIVPTDSPDTLPIIYERGLFGMYHDWCESFSTYPRTYDLLHADHLFSSLKKRCKLSPVIVEVDRILRPQGKLIVRDSVDVISEVEKIARSLKWEIRMSFSKQNEGILCVMKTMWRPQEVEGSASPKS